MKSTNSNDDSSKPVQNKSSKKSTKSRSKSSKSETTHSASVSKASPAAATNSSITNPLINSNSYVPTTPTTPTPTSISTHTGNIFDATLAPSGSGIGVSNVPSDMNSSGGSSGGSRSHHKNYAGFEPRSIKIIWEQHDQSDIELSQEVCTRLAEDASYKIWELINNIKIYARHSGGVVTYDLVNEVLRDADVPPALGATDSPWDRVDYDGSFFFYSDKILELRDEYQKDIKIEMPLGADFMRSWIIEDKNIELLRKYIPSLVYVILYGENANFELALQEASFSPLIAACYRVLIAKLIQILAYKQADRISLRCWRLLRACAVNPYVREVDCRKEYFHMAEILICQLIGPLECIKLRNDNPIKVEQKPDISQDVKQENVVNVKEESNQQQQTTMKSEVLYSEQQEQQQAQSQTPLEAECIFQLQPEEDGTNDADADMNESTSSTTTIISNTSLPYSPYFASPVDFKYIDHLCTTLGLLGAMSGYFQSECLFLITRRLERFFVGREVTTEKEYNYIGRALRGLISLGEYAFREFIPFIFKFKADDIPESLWNDFALSAVYLHGPDDIFLYEWLEYVCGGDKLQPFMVYYAEYHEKLQTMRFLQRKQSTFRINPKLGSRRLEWSTLAAAMCHGDDPNKALKPKPKMHEVFPELAVPNLHLNRSGNIRFKFAGCRPVILRPKTNPATSNSIHGDCGTDANSLAGNGIGHHDIIIAKRKLFKPLSNERRTVPLSSYFYARI